MTAAAVIHVKSGPNILVRFIWWLFIGSWASAIVIVLAWLALVFIVTIPIGIWLINHIPSVLTLRPRTRQWVLGQDDQGRTVVSEKGRPQVAWPLRGVWFIFIGCWASGVWMIIAWLISLTVIGLPIALLMFNRTPFVASLYRY